MPAHRFSPPREHTAISRASARQAFTLVAVLSILALVVIVLISLSTLVHVETRSTGATKNLLAARQNALLGLQVAMGQLQKHAGKDQAATFPATTYFPEKDVVSGTGDLYDGTSNGSDGVAFQEGFRDFAQTSNTRSYINRVETYLTHEEREEWETALQDWWNNDEAPRNPFWTGIMDTALRTDRFTNPDSPQEMDPQIFENNYETLFGEPKRDQIPVWLVSGNENYTVDQLNGQIIDKDGTVYQGADAIEDSGYYTPDMVLPDPDQDDSVVWLVDEGSATLAADATDGLDGRVKAPKQELTVRRENTDGNGFEERSIGHYAYWVGDESIKANFAVHDPYDSAGVGSREYRNRLQSPQRIGWENITGFDQATFDANDERLAYVNSANEISLLEDSNTEQIQEATRESFHSLTAYSRGLLTDMSRGGLRKDLTRYLQDGDGLNDNDPIADPDDYISETQLSSDPNRSDPRFQPHTSNGGVTNGGGFPYSTTNIPNWGDLRFWYENEAQSNQDAITPNGDTAPVLTYIMFHDGFSYEDGTIRYHWFPAVTLWNPYDIALEPADYLLEIGVNPDIWKIYIAYPNPPLAWLQMMEPNANWQDFELTTSNADLTTGEVTGPNGHLIYKAVNNGGSTLVAPYELTEEQIEELEEGGSLPDLTIYRGEFDGEELSGAPSTSGEGAPDYYYFVKSTANPDTLDLSNGPWPVDKLNEDEADDGASDAFGRFFFRMDPAEEWMSGSVGGGRQSVTGRNVSHRFRPFDPERGGPIDFPFYFKINSGFEAGQVKIFTMGEAPDDTQEWSPANSSGEPNSVPIELTNKFDPDFPASFYFDALEVNRPIPDIYNLSSDPILKFYSGSNLGGSQYAPTVRFTTLGANGEEVILENTDATGIINSGHISRNRAGDNLQNMTGYGDGSKEDADGDGEINRNEAWPKFVDRWRPLHSFTNFDQHFQTQDPMITSSTMHSAGAVWIAPLTGAAGSRQDAVHENLAALSRFNLGAKSYDPHPLVDANRSLYGGNNEAYDNQSEGFTKLHYVKSDYSPNQKWDSNQSTGSDGYALIDYKNEAGQDYLGLSKLPIRNVKRATSEILSLGQFQQVNLSPHFWQPTFPIGNADAAPYTDREGIAGINTRIVGGGQGPIGRVPNTPQNEMLDMSYLLNENLWDRYFLSTIPNSGWQMNDPLPNSRLRVRAEANPSMSDLKNFDTASAYLMNFGAFNVNSTSVEAWTALLTAFRDLKLESQIGGSTNPDETVPIARSLDPIQQKVDFAFNNSSNGFDLSQMEAPDFGNVSTGKDYLKVAGGFRYMTDAMIRVLAERIVDEVRLRGPFLSLADFVNRRLIGPEGSNEFNSEWYQARSHGRVGKETANGGDKGFADNQVDFMDVTYDPFPGLQGLNGTLQRALNVSGVNGGVNHPSLGFDGSGAGYREDRVYSLRIRNAGTADYQSIDNWKQHTDEGIGGRANTDGKHAIDPAFRGHLDTEHLAAAPVGEAGQLFQGAPGFITQGDLLSMIGPALTARGDTFLIRTYGDVTNPRSGEVEAQAWLEAIVQRIPEPVKSQGNGSAEQWSPEANTAPGRLGRKFEILKLRWLNPDEV